MKLPNMVDKRFASPIASALRRRPAVAMALALACGVAGAKVYDDGQVHLVDSDIASDVKVYDSEAGLPTTVITRDAAQVVAIAVNDHSRVQVHDSTRVGNAIIARDHARLEIDGGSADYVDVIDSASALIGGGSFLGGNNALRLFHAAVVEVAGGNFRGASNAVVAQQSTQLTISGGSFAGRVQATDSARMTISGGLFLGRDGGPGDIYSAYDAQTTIYGRSFNLPFGIVPRDFDGRLTGTLANGDAIDANLDWGGFNNSTGYILLAQAVPEPQTWALWLAGGLALSAVRRRHAAE